MQLKPTEAQGIFQSDIIIRGALIAGIADLRANDWLLDYIFSSLISDDLTAGTYGLKEIEQAKKWFKATDIPVVMNVRVDEAKTPCISIALTSSNEDVNTLGDIHHTPRQPVEAKSPDLVPRFSVLSYDPETGIVEIPEETGDALVISTSMALVDATGARHEILEARGRYILVIAENVIADFTSCTFRAAIPQLVAHLESAVFKESYVIGCHVQGEPVHLTYLHSIVTFILLRYREALLEARGFERSFFSSSDFGMNPAFDVELTWSRFISITGYVRQSWPKLITDAVLAQMPVIVAAPGNVPAEDPNDLLWLGDQDPIGLLIDE